jgi:hypothetical protein
MSHDQDHLRRAFGRILHETASDGVSIFGPYAVEGYAEWHRFVYCEFPDLARLFRLEERLQSIDYMNYFDFENHIGRKYAGPLGADIGGQQPFCVVAFARHDDAWYSRPRGERSLIEHEQIDPSLEPLVAHGITFLALNTCDVTQGPQQFFLWEAPSLEVIATVRSAFTVFRRYHRGARMLIGRKVEG